MHAVIANSPSSRLIAPVCRKRGPMSIMGEAEISDYASCNACHPEPRSLLRAKAHFDAAVVADQRFPICKARFSTASAASFTASLKVGCA
jgi:hypothetical protein